METKTLVFNASYLFLETSIPPLETPPRYYYYYYSLSSFPLRPVAQVIATQPGGIPTT